MRTINIEAASVDFRRLGSGKLIAEIWAETPGLKSIKVNLKFSFDCLPYFLPRLKKEWEIERGLCLHRIERINAVLP